jgi:hypothetical protein
MSSFSWNFSQKTIRTRKHYRVLLAVFPVLLGFGLFHQALADSVADITAGTSANVKAGWIASPGHGERDQVSSRSIDEFVQMTDTQTPIESQTPLTEAEMEALASESVPIDKALQAEPETAAEIQADAVRQYDYFTWEECRAKGDNISAFKNHFAWCMVKPVRYSAYSVDPRTGRRILVGQMEFRVTVLGRGVRGSQHMAFNMMADAWTPLFGVVPQTSKLGVHLSCLPSMNGVCNAGDTMGREDTIAGWMADGVYGNKFDASRSPGGGDLIHFDIDKVSYHDLEVVISDGEGPKFSFLQPFRCDAAPYADHGACIFHEVTSVVHYRLDSDHAGVAEHIKFAQEHPDQTYPPFGAGSKIPGKPGTAPLTRLYAHPAYVDPRLPGGEENSLYYYSQNRAVVRRACWDLGLNPSERRGLQCDEYPFASTYEGAHFTELNPGSFYKYSVRYVNGRENMRAGRILQNWYRADHVIARDAFYVQIDP